MYTTYTCNPVLQETQPSNDGKVMYLSSQAGVSFTAPTLRFETYKCSDKAMPQLRRLVAGFPPWRPGFESMSGHMGFVVDEVALGHVFSEYFGYPCQFYQMLYIHHLSSGAGT
jgi:hypothetical protein